MPYLGRAPVGVAGNKIDGDLKVTGTISGESINDKLALDTAAVLNDHFEIESGGTDGSGTNAGDNLLIEDVAADSFLSGGGQLNALTGFAATIHDLGTPTSGTVNYGTDLTLTISTENGTDTQGYAATVRDLDIGVLTNTTALPNANGVGTFVVRTGANAGGKSGQTVVDITGVNSGARNEFTLTVSASGAAA